MLNYLLETSICWTLFYILYAVGLRKETFFVTNRFFLLGALFAGLIIPVVEFPVQHALPTVYLSPINDSLAQIEYVVTAASEPSFQWSDILKYIYYIGVAFFALRLLYGLFKICLLYFNSDKIREPSHTIIYTNQLHLPFSFFNCLFWSKQFDVDLDEQRQIWQHETAHIKQGHSFDVLFIELLLVFFWCSPILLLYRKALKITHEYLADDAVLQTTHHLQYGQMLIKQAKPNLQIAFANYFFHSHLKQRILMMTKNRSTRRASWKYLPIIPLFALTLVLFSNKDVRAQVQQLVQSNAMTATDSIPKYEGEIFKVVEEMPRFIGCEDITNLEERNKCATQKLLEYLYRNIKYPKAARDVSIEGTTVVEFVVETDGYISNLNMLRKIGGGCDEEVIRLVQSMNNGQPSWIPGKQRGKNVRVRFVLPVKFKWQSGATAKEEQTEKLEQKETAQPDEIVVVGHGKQHTEIFNVVEEMPRFDACEEVAEGERATCAQQKLFMFIYNNLKYPKAARNAGIEGTPVVQFVVEKDGSISNIKIVHSAATSIDNAVLDMMQKMQDAGQKWVPGKQRGRVVRVKVSLPVKFKLGDDEVGSRTDNQATTSAESNTRTLELHQFSIRPNPASDQLTVAFEAQAVPTRLLLMSMDGKVVYEQSLPNFDGNYNDILQVENLAKGIYLLKIAQAEKVFAEQVVVE